MAGRPLAKPTEPTPVGTVEEQAQTAPAAADSVPPAGTPPTDEEKARVAAAEAADETSATPAPSPSPEKPAKAKDAKAPKHRFEEFDATRPDGTVVHIRRNIDTGAQEVTEK